VTWHYDNNDQDYEDPPPEPARKRRVSPTIIGALLLAIIGSGSAFAWRAFGGSPYPSFAVGIGYTARDQKMVGLDEFRAFQEQIAEQIKSNAQGLAAQQAEVKRLSDQLAAVLAKADAVQSSIASARAALPAAPPKSPKPAAAKQKTPVPTSAPPVQLAPTPRE
jgi:uncharacterized coiled-coil protein SlyX